MPLLLDLESIDTKHGKDTILDALEYKQYTVKSQRGVTQALSNKSRGRLRQFGIEEVLLATHFVRDHSYLHEVDATAQTLYMFDNKIHKRSIIRRKVTLDSYLQDFFYYDELTRIKGTSWVRNIFRFNSCNFQQERCAVQIRLGDVYSELRESYGVLSEKYYLSAMTIIMKNNPKIIFDIFSNDIPLAKELYGGFNYMNVKWIESKPEPEKGFTIDSFLKFSSYDYKIVGNSTFGFASAKMGSPKAHVLYPSQMYKKAESMGIRNIPADWSPIESDFF